ncbi:MAG TPA: hypothetical protein VMD03_07565 [Steroidobacteraceae bacterium]|nr:hypothetical protein [Steroidobacteraceae bacterium]
MSSPADRLARYVLASPDSYRRWEAEHDRLMRAVSRETRFVGQVMALRSTAFALVHRKAMMEYMGERQLTGAKRMRLFQLFYGCRDYSNAVVLAHGDFVRCSSSYLCTHHLAERLMHDAAFDEPMRLYERFFAEYFGGFCDVELAESEEERQRVAPLAALRPLLKHRLTEAREAILAMPQNPTREWREVTIRKPTGDTQRMRTIFGDR